STKTTNYQSVSEVKQLFEEPDDGQLVKINLSNSNEELNFDRDKTFERPKFLQETTKATAAEIGQATHLILQKLDLTLEVSRKNIEKAMKNLVSEGVLNQKITERIEVNKIIDYFKSDFGQKIRKNGDKVKKEVLFSLLIEAGEVFEEMEGLKDSILIHGMIDGYFELKEGLVLFDYKTDRLSHLTGNTEEILTNRYNSQLRLYKKALEEITNKEVVEMAIIALDTGETIYLE
ncbi:MAG: PD-(D/E)XK nuclease family protein, partial [Atopostipes sp.]|nr:PD-(D/E)XK nuclease family protein [Atopostipes sp.]